jgi:hypothetical protein
MVLYTIPNNINQQEGVARISSAISYTNEGVNHSQPYIETYQNTIPNGFIESGKVALNSTGSKFDGDTLIINFSVFPTSGPVYSMVNKYKKLP